MSFHLISKFKSSAEFEKTISISGAFISHGTLSVDNKKQWQEELEILPPSTILGISGLLIDLNNIAISGNLVLTYQLVSVSGYLQDEIIKNTNDLIYISGITGNFVRYSDLIVVTGSLQNQISNKLDIANFASISASFYDNQVTSSQLNTLTGDLQNQINTNNNHLSYLSTITGGLSTVSQLNLISSGLQSVKLDSSIFASISASFYDNQVTSSQLNTLTGALQSQISNINISSQIAPISAYLQQEITNNLRNFASISASFYDNQVTTTQLNALTGNLQLQISNINISSQIAPISAYLQQEITNNLRNFASISASFYDNQVTTTQLNALTGNLQNQINTNNNHLSYLSTITGGLSTVSQLNLISSGLQTNKLDVSLFASISASFYDNQVTTTQLNGLTGALLNISINNFSTITGSFVTTTNIDSISSNLQSQINTKLDSSNFASISASFYDNQVTTTQLNGLTGALQSQISNINISSQIAPISAYLQQEITNNLRNFASISASFYDNQVTSSQLNTLTGDLQNQINTNNNHLSYLSTITGGLSTVSQLNLISSGLQTNKLDVSLFASISASFYDNQVTTTQLNGLTGALQSQISNINISSQIAPISAYLQQEITNNLNNLSYLSTITGSFSTLTQLSSISSNLQAQINNISSISGSSSSTSNIFQEIDNKIKENILYAEFIYGGSNVSTINYWNNSNKNTKYYSKDFVYISGGSVIHMAIATRISDYITTTKTFEYTLGNVTGITYS